MAHKSYTVGPGSLIIGDIGDPQQINAQITSATVEWEVDSEDDETVLSGEVIAGEDTFTATLTGELFQDISADGFVTYTWEHRGEVKPFTYVPNTVEDRQVTGELKIVPLNVGGDVKTKAKSEFEFPCVGEPDLGNAP